jgi:hypothetical protein
MSTNNLRYGLGYDWDSTFPGVAALVISMGLSPLVDPARQYLEGYILQKWAVSGIYSFSYIGYLLSSKRHHMATGLHFETAGQQEMRLAMPLAWPWLFKCCSAVGTYPKLWQWHLCKMTGA